MTTIATTVTPLNTSAITGTPDTAAFPRTPEAHPTSKLSKAEIAMRIELRNTIDAMTEAAGSATLNDWERHYLTDLIGKFQQYGPATRLSLAQVMTLNRCMAKAILAA